MCAAKVFWQEKTLEQMSQAQWEALCDGCGLCCLHKLEDEDDGEIYFTDVACRQLNPATCQCNHYSKRQSLVPDCLTLTSENVQSVTWLPATCAYRLLKEGKPLFDWHPLVSGDPDSVHSAGISAQHRCVSEDDVSEDELEERIVHWIL